MALLRALSGFSGLACRTAPKGMLCESIPGMMTSSLRQQSTLPAAYSGLVKNEMALTNTTQALKTVSEKIDYDERVHARFAPGSEDTKQFSYFVLTGGRFLYAACARLIVLKFIYSMSASKDVLALASAEVDLSNIAMGNTVTIKWRGKPVFIRRRTEAEIADANSVDVAALRDPQTDSERSSNPEWLITIGVCTHLGCVPLANAGDFGGWFCPCHGSHYDVSGRIRKGPAPYNLEVPEYKFLDDTHVLIG